MATKYPPALDVNEAITVVEKMHEKHGGNEVAVDLMPEILNVKSGSSYFPAKISALQKYGLAKKSPQDMLILTELAMQIVNPISDDERMVAIASLFENTDVLSDFYTKYGKTNLPSPEQVKATLNKNHGIDRDYVGRWYDYIVSSFKAIRALPLITLKLKDESLPTKPQLDTKRTDLFKIPLTEKKVFEFSMPNDMTNDDLDYVISFFELRKKKNVK